MKVLATDLKKGDHIVGYPSNMVVESVHEYKRIFGGNIWIVVSFNTGNQTFLEPENEEEVDRRKSE
jgi:hypothetical protein